MLAAENDAPYTDRELDQIRSALKSPDSVVSPNATLEQALAVLFQRYGAESTIQEALNFQKNGIDFAFDPEY